MSMARSMSRRRIVTIGAAATTGVALPLMAGTAAEAAPLAPADDPGRVFDVTRRRRGRCGMRRRGGALSRM
jgi:hypothetical protein